MVISDTDTGKLESKPEPNMWGRGAWVFSHFNPGVLTVTLGSTNTIHWP